MNPARDTVTGSYTRTYWETDWSINWWCKSCGKGHLGKAITTCADNGCRKRRRRIMGRGNRS